MSEEKEFNKFQRRVRGLWEEVDVWGVNKGDVLRINSEEKLWVCVEPRQTINNTRGLVCDPYVE
jgi:hypothetical protein